MNKAIITNAVVSKGYDGADALKFTQNEGVYTSVQFKIGYRVYDSRAKDKHRYVNFAIKAFGSVCERIVKMQLKEGSYVNIFGRLDEDRWEDNGQKLSRTVIILEDIEFSSNGSGKSGGNGADAKGTAAAACVTTQETASQSAPHNPPAAPPAASQSAGSAADQTDMPPGFTGFNGFGEENSFFPMD